MDNPVAIYSKGHRDLRHDTSFIPSSFIEKYGEDLCKHVMLDHIVLDKNVKKRRKKRERTGKYSFMVSYPSTAHIPYIIFQALEIDLPIDSEERRAEIQFLICPDIVLLYNPERFDKLIDNLKLLLARLLLKRGNLNEVRQMLSEGLISNTTGEVVPQTFLSLSSADAAPER